MRSYSKFLKILFLISFSSDPWTAGQAIWTFCFALIMVIAILGNCIVLWIILGKTRNRHANNACPFGILIAFSKKFWKHS